MSKRGRTPSLIGSRAGASKFVTVKGKRKCKRCGAALAKGDECVEVGIPGSLGHRTYCLTCYGEILDQSEKHLKKLKGELENRL